MRPISFRALVATALFFVCGAAAAATSHSHSHNVAKSSPMDLPCNPLTCSVKGP